MVLVALNAVLTAAAFAITFAFAIIHQVIVILTRRCNTIAFAANARSPSQLIVAVAVYAAAFCQRVDVALTVTIAVIARFAGNRDALSSAAF